MHCRRESTVFLEGEGVSVCRPQSRPGRGPIAGRRSGAPRTVDSITLCLQQFAAALHRSWLSHHLTPRHMLPWWLHALRLARKPFTCNPSRPDLTWLHCTIGADQDVHVTGVDVNSAMAPYARDAASAAGAAAGAVATADRRTCRHCLLRTAPSTLSCARWWALPHCLRPTAGWTKAHVFHAWFRT